MRPICPHRPSRLFILHSVVVRVLLFRKRPSETNSGLGIETPTDAVTVVRLQLLPYPLSSSPVSVSIFLLQVLFDLPCTKDLVRIPSCLVSRLLPHSQHFSPLRDKGSPSADNDSSKGTPTQRLSTPQGLLGRAIAVKQDSPFSASSRQSTLQRQRAVSMSPAPGHAAVHAPRRARQTTGRNVSNESTSLQDTRQGSKGLSKLHWLI